MNRRDPLEVRNWSETYKPKPRGLSDQAIGLGIVLGLFVWTIAGIVAVVDLFAVVMGRIFG